MKVINSAQLSRFRGSKSGGKIYVSIRGEVFDVSVSHHLYGPDGPYHVFAGREIARSLALFSLDEEVIGLDKVDDLEEEEKRNLEEWIEKFRKRYKIVAQLKTTKSRWTRFIPIASAAISAIAIAVLVSRAK